MDTQDDSNFDVRSLEQVEELPLPDTLPVSGGIEYLRVFEDGADGIHISLSDILSHPESWGVCLAEVGKEIVRQIASDNDMSMEEAQAHLNRGFNAGHGFWRPGLSGESQSTH